MKKNKKEKKKMTMSLRRGNITLIRLLIAAKAAGPSGISTMELLRELGTTDYGQTVLRLAVREGLIEREVGQSEHGQFPPIFNIITDRGKRLLQSQLIKGEVNE